MYRPYVSSWPMKTAAELADGSILYVKPTVSVGSIRDSYD